MDTTDNKKWIWIILGIILIIILSLFGYFYFTKYNKAEDIKIEKNKIEKKLTEKEILDELKSDKESPTELTKKQETVLDELKNNNQTNKNELPLLNSGKPDLKTKVLLDQLSN